MEGWPQAELRPPRMPECTGKGVCTIMRGAWGWQAHVPTPGLQPQLMAHYTEKEAVEAAAEEAKPWLLRPQCGL